MKRNTRRTRRGFSLVELLAVVLVLAVLAGVAVPIYLNTRKDSAARACRANIAMIASAETAYATRFSTYCFDGSGAPAVSTNYTAGATPTGGLVGAPEGLSKPLVCPLDGTAVYTCTANATTATAVDISCPNAASHATATGSAATNWTVTLQPSGKDSSNNL